MLTMWGIAPTLTRSTGTHILAFSAPPRSIIYKFTNTKITNNQLFQWDPFYTNTQLNNKQLFHQAMGSFGLFFALVGGKICTQKHTHKCAKVFSTLKKITSEVEANGEIVLILFRWNLFNR